MPFPWLRTPRKPFWSEAKGGMVTQTRGPSKPAIHALVHETNDIHCSTPNPEKVTDDVFEVTCECCKFNLRQILSAKEL